MIRSSRPRRWLACALMSSAAWTFAPVAHAGDVARARRIFSEGVRLFQSGDWEGARRLFREADAEHHAPAIVYNMGLAEEKLGHPQAAVDLYESYIAEAGTGERGDFAIAAAAAIAQIKARSTRLRVDTKPPGARVFVDGAVVNETSPITALVPAGHHVVVVQGDGWSKARDIEVLGAGDLVTLLVEAPERDVAPSAAPIAAPLPPSADAPHVDAPPPAPRPSSSDDAPDGLVSAASFAIVPVYLLGVTTPLADNARPGLSIVAGPLVELGHAVSDRLELLVRAFGGLGPDAKPSYAYMGGPGLSYRIGLAWLGASFLAGELETRVRDARYGTDLVFGSMFEANVVVMKKAGGEWLAGVQPSFLLTARRQDNTALFLPLTFGYRAY